jgi:hypothetical protein
MGSDPSLAATDLWVGEWKSRIVIFDPSAQKPGAVDTYFDVGNRALFYLLPDRTRGQIRRLGDRSSHAAEVERYEAWQALQPRKGSARTRPRPPAPRVPNLPAHAEVRISPEVFDRDWASFERHFPEGFASLRYLEEERSYKLSSGDAIRGALPREVFTLPEEELVAAVKRGFSATENLVHRTEHAAMHDALGLPGEARTRCLRALGELLWDDEAPVGHRFERWVDALEALPHRGKRSPLSWPVATALPFLARPDQHCILKPERSRSATRRYGFDPGYVPQPNAVTYQRWLCFVEALSEPLMQRGARDRLDVQSFLWRVDPSS